RRLRAARHAGVAVSGNPAAAGEGQEPVNRRWLRGSPWAAPEPLVAGSGRVPRSVERVGLPALVHRAIHIARDRVRGGTADRPAIMATAVRVRHRTADNLSVRDVTIHAGGGRVRG